MQARLLPGVLIALFMLFIFAAVAVAQDQDQSETDTPYVQIPGIGVQDGSVIITATMDAPGWIVIHADDDGEPGPVIGHAPLSEGVNTDVAVEVDEEGVTPILHAMLHVDEGEEGVYEFPGPDGPVMIDDDIVMAAFSASPVIEEEETSEPATVPTTGGSTSVSLIFTVVIAALVVLGASVAASHRGQV